MKPIETVSEMLEIKEKIKEVSRKINNNIESEDKEGFDYWTEVKNELIKVQIYLNERIDQS